MPGLKFVADWPMSYTLRSFPRGLVCQQFQELKIMRQAILIGLKARVKSLSAGVRYRCAHGTAGTLPGELQPDVRH